MLSNDTRHGVLAHDIPSGILVTRLPLNSNLVSCGAFTAAVKDIATLWHRCHADCASKAKGFAPGDGVGTDLHIHENLQNPPHDPLDDIVGRQVRKPPFYLDTLRCFHHRSMTSV